MLKSIEHLLDVFLEVVMLVVVTASPRRVARHGLSTLHRLINLVVLQEEIVFLRVGLVLGVP